MPLLSARSAKLFALAAWAMAGCGGEAEMPGERARPADLQTFTCGAGCGGQLGSAVLPGPSGPVTLTAWSNSPQLGTDNDCDPTACAGVSPVTAQNGHLSYGCPWQCVELVNRYFQGTWGDPKIQADAGAAFCQYAASSSRPQYWVYGQYGASTAGHAPMAGDALVWSSHVAIATNAVSAGAAGTLGVIEQNATCSGTDTVSWSGSLFGGKYGLSPLCWVHVVANTGATGPLCPTGGNWHLAGDYCGSEPGMQSATANTLYSCAAAGGAASVKQVCSGGCLQMPAGQNDQCASAQPNGATCSAQSQCQSGQCVSGVCCSSACGPCGTCASGTCTPLPAGNGGSPSCGASVCDGASAVCPGGCTADDGCAPGDYCKAGSCVARQANGAACSAAAECSSANCVSAVCCDSACGPCGSCASGTCTPLAAHASGQPSCGGGLLCSGSSAACPAGCATSDDCAPGYSCSASTCVPQAAPDAGTDTADAGTQASSGEPDAGTSTNGAVEGQPPAAVSATGCESADGGSSFIAAAALLFSAWRLAESRRSAPSTDR